MKVFAISDLHMSTTTNKPMDIFGGKWQNYMEKIRADWQTKVSDSDIVLIGGDISWAMDLDEAMVDIKTLTDLKGKKIFVRGNHDYWWKSITRLRQTLPENFYALQNDSLKFENVILCGSRAWCVEGSPDFKEQDRKIYMREVERLRMALQSTEKIREEGDRLFCLIHYPPFNVKRDNSLFTDLFEANGVEKVIYGHLHGNESKTDLLVRKNGIDYFLTSCDQLDNKLALIYDNKQ